MNTRRKATIATAAAIAAIALATPPANAAEPNATAIDDYLTELVDTTGVPGLAATVTHGDQVIHAAGYGHDTNGDPITEHTPMRVASVSKAFTSTAVMILAEEGRIALDDTVASQLPEFDMQDPRADHITVRQLLNQTSGFSDTTIDVVELETATSLQDYVTRLGDDTLATDPGTDWAYCNANHNVAARLVEVASGQPFADFMQERVFNPLAMTDSATNDHTITPALGHNSLFGLWIPREEAPGFLTDSGSGGIISSAADMAQWLITQNGQGEQLLTPETLQALHTPSPVQDYALGWDVQPDGTLVHSGNLMTYNAVQWIDPATGYGIAVLTTGAGLADVTYAALDGLTAILDGETPETPTNPRGTFELALAAVALAAIALAALGITRSRRWARKHTTLRAPATWLRLTWLLIPAAAFAAYPAGVSLISGGRTITWPSVWYFALPFTLTLLITGLAGVAVLVARVWRLRSIGSAS
ncbi:serine hydrolase domain-containing protein [Glycomyces sp. NPDC046736]|uniref:serine hydrolase domain-containing protein n=1 Tax=Glycomyces sp. NPDC046736 TaxID=3155615 RepID=UPI0033D33685